MVLPQRRWGAEFGMDKNPASRVSLGEVRTESRQLRSSLHFHCSLQPIRRDRWLLWVSVESNGVAPDNEVFNVVVVE